MSAHSVNVKTVCVLVERGPSLRMTGTPRSQGCYVLCRQNSLWEVECSARHPLTTKIVRPSFYLASSAPLLLGLNKAQCYVGVLTWAAWVSFLQVLQRLWSSVVARMEPQHTTCTMWTVRSCHLHMRSQQEHSRIASHTSTALSVCCLVPAGDKRLDEWVPSGRLSQLVLRPSAQLDVLTPRLCSLPSISL